MDVEVKIIRKPIDVNNILNKLMSISNEEGSIVMYLGFVKSLVNNHRVYELIYEAYEPYAEKILEENVKSCLDEDITHVKVFHRIGDLKPHDPVLYIFVVAKKRDKAFKVAKEILEQIKRNVPIYKLEVRDDGEYWVIGDGLRIRKGLWSSSG